MSLLRKISATISSQRFALLLVVICGVIALRNFAPNQWLTGWDTLHPEFNFALNIKRVLFGVWREDQGLGTVAAHSHMSDLPRILSMWLLSALVPTESVKFMYDLLCLVLGPLGVYYFTRNSILKKHTLYRDTGAFAAGLFYLFNLGTVQHFYVVFEMFAVQYAALGWIFLFATRFVEDRNKKTALALFFVSFLAAPMAYASTLWFAFAFGLAMYLGTLVVSQYSHQRLRSAILALIFVVSANAFWLFPNLYFLLSGASATPAESHINKLFSPEAFLHNQAYGNIADIAVFKNFLFSWTQYNSSTNSTIFLLEPWIEHLKQPGVMIVGYALAILSTAGVAVSMGKKNWRALSLVPLVILSMIMLINANPPFEGLFTFLQQSSSLFKEGLRFPFTKFSILMMFGMAVFFGTFWQWLHALIVPRNKAISFISTGLITGIFIWYCLPMFQGFLINPKMRNTIPQAYLDFFTWSDSQPEQARFIQFPLQTSAGWDQYSWNYEGPGFLWFGMKQPLAVRDFDRWGEANETLFKQLSGALYANDKQLFGQLLTKYRLSFAVIDSAILDPGQPDGSRKFAETHTLLEELGATHAWSKDNLVVYDLRPITHVTAFAESPTSFTKLTTDPKFTNVDAAYMVAGDYLQVEQLPTLSFPFAQLTTDRSLENTMISDKEIVFTAPFSTAPAAAKLVVPGFSVGESFTTQFSAQYIESKLLISFSPAPSVRMGEVTTRLPMLAPIEIEISDDPAEILFQIAGQQYYVQRDGEVSGQVLTASVGKPLEVLIIDTKYIQSNGEELVVDAAHTQDHLVGESIWIPIQENVVIDTSGVQQGNLTVTVPSRSLAVDLENKQWAFNCDTFNRGSIEKQVIDGTAIYRAIDRASICEHFTLGQLHGLEPFLMVITGDGKTGRGVKTYLRNTQTHKLEVEQLLPEGPFTSIFSIIPGQSSEPNRYTLTIETRSFGSRASVNEISSIKLFPLGYIQKINQMRFVAADTIVSQDNGIELVSSSKISPSQYTARVVPRASVSDQPTGLVVLQQAYDSGWIAVTKDNYLTVLPHHKFNGWANAWQVPAKNTTVIMFYWPQLLEEFGLAVLVGTAAILITVFWRHRRSLITGQKSTTVQAKIHHSLRGR